MMRIFTTFFKRRLQACCTIATIACSVLSLMLTVSTACRAQTTRSFSSDIHTPQINIAGAWNSLPILSIKGNQRVEISFDDLGEEPQRYYYRIEHCDAHFQPTENLFESAYLQATDAAQLLEDYEPSRNTTVNYYHYNFKLPNEDMKMLISGNYRITIERDDDERTPIVETYLMVLDAKTSVKASITTNTDIDWNQQHQQLTIEVEHSKLNLHNPQQQLQCVVLKNRDWKNAVWLSAPTYSTGNSVKWMHTKELIFKAGNEWRKFENLSTSEASLHTESIGWNPVLNLYEACLYVDEPRKNYLFEKDHNGAFYIRNIDGYDNNTESEYINVHFTLNTPQRLNNNIYVTGAWATNNNRETYRMLYNAETNAYEANILLKQGYYNYYYYSDTDDIEGNFYETENEYTILVYATQPNMRYTQLVGMGQIKSGK